MALELLPDVGTNPDYGLALTRSYRVNKVQFGDGYSEARPAGPNNIVRSWQVTWTLLDKLQKDILVEFFDRMAGAYAFLAVPNPADNETPIQVKTDGEVQVTYADYEDYQVTVTLKEDFGIV